MRMFKTGVVVPSNTTEKHWQYTYLYDDNSATFRSVYEFSTKEEANNAMKERVRVLNRARRNA